MKIIDPGHTYEVESYDGGLPQLIRFMKRPIVPGRTEAHPGTNCQELLRVVIDRVKDLDAEKRWSGNDEILASLRRTLLMFEIRAMLRKVDKGTLLPEIVKCSIVDGHFVLSCSNDGAGS